MWGYTYLCKHYLTIEDKKQMGKKWTPEMRKAASERAKAQIAAAKAQNPQTNTPTQNSISSPTVEPERPSVADETVTPLGTTQLITLTPEQLNELVTRLAAGNTTDKAPSPTFNPASNQLQTNSFGQVVGTVTKFNVDPDYYPSPIEKLAVEPRLSRFAFDYNYFLTWDITSKPYDTKDNISMREPTFHITLYMNRFDEAGNETGEAIVVQTLHFNEDQDIAFQYAASLGLTPTAENMREIMDISRYERSKKWLMDIFFPENIYKLTVQDREEAIGGQVVKVVTKSNVKGFGNKAPTVSDEELGI